MCRTVSSHIILIRLCGPLLELNADTSAAIAVQSFMAWSGMSVVICMFDTMVGGHERIVTNLSTSLPFCLVGRHHDALAATISLAHR